MRFFNLLMHESKAVPALICLFLAGISAGCMSPRARVDKTYEYHHRYDDMTDRYDPPISLVRVNSDFELSSYTHLVIGEFTAGGDGIYDLETANHYAGTYFRQVMAGEFTRKLFERELFGTPLFYKVELDPDFRSDSHTAVIEGKFTIFDPGSPGPRYLSAYLFFLQPIAAVDLQVEGRIRDANCGTTILEFADRRRFLGHTPWGPSHKTLNEEWAKKQTCLLTARSLVNLVLHLREKS